MSFGKFLLFVDLSFLSRQRERSISTLENAYGAIMYSCAFHVSTDLALNTRAVAATYIGSSLASNTDVLKGFPKKVCVGG